MNIQDLVLMRKDYTCAVCADKPKPKIRFSDNQYGTGRTVELSIIFCCHDCEHVYIVPNSPLSRTGTDPESAATWINGLRPFSSTGIAPFPGERKWRRNSLGIEFANPPKPVNVTSWMFSSISGIMYSVWNQDTGKWEFTSSKNPPITPRQADTLRAMEEEARRSKREMVFDEADAYEPPKKAIVDYGVEEINRLIRDNLPECDRCSRRFGRGYLIQSGSVVRDGGDYIVTCYCHGSTWSYPIRADASYAEKRNAIRVLRPFFGMPSVPQLAPAQIEKEPEVFVVSTTRKIVLE